MFIGRTCSMKNMNWKSKIKPPDWVFGVVWTILYTLMAISLYNLICYGRKDPWFKFTIVITIISYLLNYMYVYIAGCQKDWQMALYVFIVYLIILPVQILCTYTIVPIAGVLLSPVLGWAIYAIMMNAFYIDQQK